MGHSLRDIQGKISPTIAIVKSNKTVRSMTHPKRRFIRQNTVLPLPLTQVSNSKKSRQVMIDDS